jgi:hypothetical protein
MNPRKNPCTSLDSFRRIGAFQWVTANPNKKFLLRLHSRRGLWAIAANRSLAPPASAPRSPLPELIIAEDYSQDFCLMQEKSGALLSYHCCSQPLSSWPGLYACTGYPRRQRFKDGPTWGGRQQSFAGKAFALPRSRTFDAPNHVDSRGKPGHDALKFVQRSLITPDSDDQQLSRREQKSAGSRMS